MMQHNSKAGQINKTCHFIPQLGSVNPRKDKFCTAI